MPTKLNQIGRSYYARRILSYTFGVGAALTGDYSGLQISLDSMLKKLKVEAQDEKVRDGRF